jgi:hypothetical protein
MKRHFCAAAGALVLALAGAGTATAGGLPILGGQQGVQSASLGDQSVGEQTNDAGVTQKQGSFNVNVSPAIAILGDASTENAQGNGNTAVAGVSQSNEATQSQTVDQAQRLEGGSGGCCASGGQEASQSSTGGAQSVGEQRNDADVTQEQGNGNVNISPAIAIGGDASTHNEQGNGNTAAAFVDQANSAEQSQDVAQEQSLTSGGGGCCGARSQSAEQTVSGGDQSVDKQKNDADVTQEQGNGNLNISPAIAIGGDASTSNAQGNGNKALAAVGQSNTAEQSQDVVQKQSVTSGGGGCCGAQSQSAGQKADGGDQSVGTQRNDADVTQEQGSGNVNVSPAIAFGGVEKHDSCGPCGKEKGGAGGSSASTWNAQGNGNKAVAAVGQSNTAEQSQDVVQKQSLTSKGGCCAKPHKAQKPRKPSCKTPKKPEHPCCGTPGQTATQSVDAGDQSVGKQRNDADVTQTQGSGNVNASPAIAFGGGKTHDSCGPCGKEKGGAGGSSASTWNAQGNGNQAAAWVSQGNSATQSQSTWQGQSLVDACREVMRW